MSDKPDIHHQINSHLASLKAGLFLLDRDLGGANEDVKKRLTNMDEQLTQLHTLLKAVLHDVPKASD